MKPLLYILLFALVLIAPFVTRMAMTTERATQSAAYGAARLIVVTPHNQDIRREFARGFGLWHSRLYGQEVFIDYRVPGGTNDIRRLLEKTYDAYRDSNTKLLPANMPADIDVVWGGGDNFFDIDLKPLGILQPLDLDQKLIEAVFPQPTLAGVKLYDLSLDKSTGQLLPPRWVGVCLSSFGIVYNSDLYSTLELPPPKTWHDLTHEKLNGLLALADPLRSGSASVAFYMVIQRAMADGEIEFGSKDRLDQLSRVDFAALEKTTTKEEVDRYRLEYADLQRRYNEALSRGWKKGMGELLLIAANARYFTDSASHVPHDVGNGQAAAGMAIDFYGRVYQESVGEERCKFVAPHAATAITPDPVAILHGVHGPGDERLLTARRFIEYLLTPEAQRLWIQRAGSPGGPVERSLRRPPIRPDVYAGRVFWTDEMNPFQDAGGFNQRPEWGRLMSDTRLIWAAAWMDSRSALKDAYESILAVKDASRRAVLLTVLADLPITMDDVAAMKRTRDEMQKANPGKVEEWKARQRIDWATVFRKHYADVETAAESKD